MNMPWDLFKEFGLVGLMVAAMAFLLFLVIKWTLDTTKEILNQSAQERIAWVKALGDHTEQAKLFHESVKEAHAYQRQEHVKLAENQNEHSKAMILICQNLSQVEKALGRINGYQS